MGRNPMEVLPQVEGTGKSVHNANADEKNVLTCLVRKTDDIFKSYHEHAGKTYTMERIPTVNLIGIKFLLPMVGGMIDGYYEVERIAFAANKGMPVLRIRLGKYHSLGPQWIHIYRTKMQPGELISMEQTLKMYHNPKQ